MIPQMVVVLGSPFYNIAMPMILLERASGFQRDMEIGIPIATVFWTFAYFGIALSLYLATLFSFDLCMGRTPEHPGGTSHPDPEPTGRARRGRRGRGGSTTGARSRPLADLSVPRRER